MDFFLGLALGNLLTRNDFDSDETFDYQIYEAWFNRQIYEGKLAELKAGKLKTSPVTFHQFASSVCVSTLVTPSLKAKAPPGYRYPEDDQGLVDNDNWARPDPQLCEEAVRRFFDLKKQGIANASIEKSCLVGNRILVTTNDGQEHTIPLSGKPHGRRCCFP